MESPFLITICILLLIVIVLITIFRSKSNSELPILQNKVAELQTSLTKIETGLKEDFRINREENATIAKDNRIELNATLKSITEQSQNALKDINKTLEEKMGSVKHKETYFFACVKKLWLCFYGHKSSPSALLIQTKNFRMRCTVGY